MAEERVDLDRRVADVPQSALEHSLIVKYLLSKGYHMSDLESLPEQTATKLMKQACLYATLKLAEIESRAKLRREIEA